MSIVAFTFGSLGDIVTLIQIANIVRKELCGLSETSVEYHDLIIELDSVVYTVSSVLSTLPVPGHKRLEQSIENALYHAVGASLCILKDINQRIFTWRRCDGRSVGTMMLGMWQRVGWRLFSKRELLDYCGRLSSQVLAMNTLLSLAQWSDLDRVGNQVTHFREESIEPFALIREIYRCVKNPPRRMGYTWEGEPDSGSTPIFFTDMLGHTITLPWELLSTRQRMHEFLLFYFRDKPGRQLVYHGTYRTLVQQRDTHVASDQRSFNYRCENRNLTHQDPKPGSRLQMYAKVDTWMKRYPESLSMVQTGADTMIFPIMASLYAEACEHRTKRPPLLRLVSQPLFNELANWSTGWVTPAPNKDGATDFPWWHFSPIPVSYMKLRCIDEGHPAFASNIMNARTWFPVTHESIS